MANKSINEIIDIFGKSPSISLSELDLTVSVQAALKMIMPSLVGLTFGMRCIPTEVLGFVACQTTSKHLGMVSAEQSCSNVKTIKNGKRANIGSESLEKRAILYTSTKLEEAQLQRNLDSSNDPDYNLFVDDYLKLVPFSSKHY